MRMCRIILSSVACPALSYFSTFLINGTIFGGKLRNTKCVFRFSLQLLSETFLSLRLTERDMIKIVHWSSCKVPVICVRFSLNLNFLDAFSKKKYSNVKFCKNPYGGSHADRRTDGIKLTVVCRNFANSPEFRILLHIRHSFFKSNQSNVHLRNSHCPLQIHTMQYTPYGRTRSQCFFMCVFFTANSYMFIYSYVT